MKITDDYLEVTEPEIAVLFLREEVEWKKAIKHVWETKKKLHAVSLWGFSIWEDAFTIIHEIMYIRIPKETARRMRKSGVLGELINKLQSLEEEIIEIENADKT